MERPVINKNQYDILTKIFIAFIGLILYSGSLIAQPQLIPTVPASNQYPITFTNPAQDEIDIFFDEDITDLGDTSGWTILIDGNPVAFVGPAFNPADHSNIKFQIAVSIDYANRNLLTVEYNKATSTASPKLGGTSGEVNSFGPITAVNNLLLSCDAFDLSRFDFSLISTETCAPIRVSYTVTY